MREKSDFLLILGGRVSWGRYKTVWYASFHMISVKIPDVFAWMLLINRNLLIVVNR